MKSIWIDVSKSTLDIYNRTTKESSKIKNSYGEIKKYLLSLTSDYVVFYESTWVYSQTTCKACNELWIKHFQMHPTTMNWLSKWLWDRNKNDKIDAKKIADTWELLYERMLSWEKIKFITPNTDQVNLMMSVLSNIQSLKKIKTKFLQLLDKENNNSYADKMIIIIYEKHIKELDKQVEKLYDKILVLIKKEWLNEKFENIISMPWINKITWVELLVFFVNLENKWFEKQDINKVKAYTWLDCIERQSWTSIHSCWISKRWNSTIRKLLYLCSLVRYTLPTKNIKYANCTLWLFFKKMIWKFSTENNKMWKSVMCAMWKKLLTIAWWIYRNNTKYNYS